MTVFVVVSTYPDDGGDEIVGVYSSKEYADKRVGAMNPEWQKITKILELPVIEMP